MTIRRWCRCFSACLAALPVHGADAHAHGHRAGSYRCAHCSHRCVLCLAWFCSAVVRCWIFGISLSAFKGRWCFAAALLSAVDGFNAAPGRQRQTPERRLGAQQARGGGGADCDATAGGAGRDWMVIVFGQSHPA